MELRGPRVLLRPLDRRDADPLLELRVRNRDFLAQWEPLRDDAFFTLAAQREEVLRAEQEWAAGRAFSFAIVALEGRSLVGRVTMSNVVRGVFQNAYLGYFLDEAHCGLGLGTEAVGLAVEYGFARGGLHRVQAAVMPRNLPSRRVLEKLGFREEGLARRYLCLNGTWEDHLLYARTSEEAKPK